MLLATVLAVYRTHARANRRIALRAVALLAAALKVASLSRVWPVALRPVTDSCMLVFVLASTLHCYQVCSPRITLRCTGLKHTFNASNNKNNNNNKQQQKTTNNKLKSHITFDACQRLEELRVRELERALAAAHRALCRRRRPALALRVAQLETALLARERASASKPLGAVLLGASAAGSSLVCVAAAIGAFAVYTYFCTFD